VTGSGAIVGEDEGQDSHVTGQSSWSFLSSHASIVSACFLAQPHQFLGFLLPITQGSFLSAQGVGLDSDGVDVDSDGVGVDLTGAGVDSDGVGVERVPTCKSNAL